jgi:hypothetical protein
MRFVPIYPGTLVPLVSYVFLRRISTASLRGLDTPGASEMSHDARESLQAIQLAQRSGEQLEIDPGN